MKNKIQLHELAAYFPNGVKAKFKESNDKRCRKYIIGTVCSIYENGTICCSDTVNAAPDEYKLLLHPIESLTPEIIAKIYGIEPNDFELAVLKAGLPKVIKSYSEGILFIPEMQLKQEAFQAFLKSHIDIFNLIKRGFAEPIK